MSPANQILPAVAAVIFNEAGAVLLQRRSDVNEWCVLSGHVEFGETVEEAILREIHEELEVDAEITRLIGIYSSPQSQTYHYTDRSVQYITTYFEVRLKLDFSPLFTNSETLELAYFDPKNLPSKLAQMHPQWLSDAINKQVAPVLR